MGKWKLISRSIFLERGPYNFLAYINFFQSNFDQTWSDCSNYEYTANLTKFGQDWTENKNKIIIGQEVVRTPFLKKNFASNTQ